MGWNKHRALNQHKMLSCIIKNQIVMMEAMIEQLKVHYRFSASIDNLEDRIKVSKNVS